jgi:hypothetical protein
VDKISTAASERESTRKERTPSANPTWADLPNPPPAYPNLSVRATLGRHSRRPSGVHISASPPLFPVANYREKRHFEQYLCDISRLCEKPWHSWNRLTQMH